MVSVLRTSNEKVMKPNIRVNISLSAHDYERLKVWALSHGKTATGFAGQIVAARIEANHDVIEQQIESLAQSEGVTREELMQIAINEED